jgi:hypothetical protein
MLGDTMIEADNDKEGKKAPTWLESDQIAQQVMIRLL